MADSKIQITVKGMKEIDEGLKKLGRSLNSYSQAAMQEAGKNILSTEGLKKYPPLTDANKEPTPFYIRGVGTQYKSRNTGSSENYGTQWHVTKVPFGAKLANRASYAVYLAGDGDGEKQSRVMGKIGWKILRAVADEKISMVKRTLEAWIEKARKDAGLK